ncbi:MAG: FecR family protein [Gammaproteobacteria bacterium]
MTDDAGTDRPASEALVWFTRLCDTGIDPATRAAFETWRRARPENAAAYARLAALWDSPAFAEALRTYETPGSGPRARRAPWRRARALALAACLVFLVIGLGSSPLLDRYRADYFTETGEQQSVTLPDGSAVTLGSATALQLEHRGHGRGVRLLRGEAYFRVRAMPLEPPFRVRTDAALVRVAGTEFSVSAASSAVAVRSGTVTYAVTGGKAPPVTLTAGQGIATRDGALGPPRPIDLAHAFAWLAGRIAFRDRPLGEVLAEVERYLPGKILIVGARLASVRVTGSYKLAEPLNIVRSLAASAKARVTTATAYLTIVH